MKHLFLLGISLLFLCSVSCSNGQTNGQALDPKTFATRITATSGATLIDVRTPKEFSKGHIEHALNYNWNGEDFDKQVSTLDKNKPVFVYCLSGGRSGEAAEKMRSSGFKEVYELSGGMMEWRNASLPETTEDTKLAAPQNTGMSRQQFEGMLTPDKIVLVDFYADWCAPCKKMTPFLDQIASKYAGKLVLIRINADENPALCKELHIDGLPYLQVYQNKALSWMNKGYIEQSDIEAHLK